MSLYSPLKHKILTRQPYLVNFIIIITWLSAFSVTLFFILLGRFLNKKNRMMSSDIIHWERHPVKHILKSYQVQVTDYKIRPQLFSQLLQDEEWNYAIDVKIWSGQRRTKLLIIRIYFLFESLIPMMVIVISNALIFYKCNQDWDYLRHNKEFNLSMKLFLVCLYGNAYPSKVLSRLNQHGRRVRTTLTCFAISLGYLICWLPIFIYKKKKLELRNLLNQT